ISTSVKDLGFSDHSATTINITIPNISTPQTTFYTNKRSFNDDNILKFKSMLKTVNWNNIMPKDQNMNENYKAFHDTLTNILNKSIPIRRIKIKNTYKKYWLTKSIKISCKNKRLLKTLKIKANNPIITNYYRKYEKILKQIVTTAKKIQYINKINKSNNKVKTMWSIINERTNKTFKKERTNLKEVQVNNKIISEPKQIANIFNNFFTSIGEESQTRTNTPKYNLSTSENTMFLSPVDPYETNLLIKNLKNKTSHESNLKNILTQTITWMNEHNLEINFEKTKTITFHPHQKKPLRLNFSFNNHTIEEVNEFTLLGITLDTNINWKSHVLKIKSKLSKFVYALVMSIKIYNKLPETLRNEKKIHVFTNKLKKILISKCYYNVKEYLDDKNII
ncbi:hypothetical protein SFRURICE_018272, partial [Spodoptera frugiperda]